MQIKHVLLASSLSGLFLMGCSRTDSTDATPPNTGTGATGMQGSTGGENVTGPARFGPDYHSDPAGAPNSALGEPMGNGFRSLNAEQSGGMGTGLQGFNDVGASGTSGTITDVHHAERGEESTAGASGTIEK